MHACRCQHAALPAPQHHTQARSFSDHHPVRHRWTRQAPRHIPAPQLNQHAAQPCWGLCQQEARPYIPQAPTPQAPQAWHPVCQPPAGGWPGVSAGDRHCVAVPPLLPADHKPDHTGHHPSVQPAAPLASLRGRSGQGSGQGSGQTAGQPGQPGPRHNHQHPPLATPPLRSARRSRGTAVGSFRPGSWAQR